MNQKAKKNIKMITFYNRSVSDCSISFSDVVHILQFAISPGNASNCFHYARQSLFAVGKSICGQVQMYACNIQLHG